MIYYFHIVRHISFFFPHAIAHLRAYFKRRRAVLRKKEARSFLNNCLKEKVIPKTLIPTNFDNHKNEPFPEIYRILIKNRIVTITKNINYDFKLCSIHYRSLKESLPHQLFITCINTIHHTLSHKTLNYKRHLSESQSVCVFIIYAHAPFPSVCSFVCRFVASL